MNDSIDKMLSRRWKEFAVDVRSLLRQEAWMLGEAIPPRESGVYILLDESMTIVYAGIAADLRDRFQKHISGDESHAIQRAYERRIPDRSERRQFIKANVRAKWHLVSDPARLADFERLLIWLLQPPWNRR